MKPSNSLRRNFLRLGWSRVAADIILNRVDNKTL